MLYFFYCLANGSREDEDDVRRHAAQLQSQGLELIQSNSVLLNGLQELRGTLYERYLLAEKWAISEGIIPSSHDDPDMPGQSQPPSQTSAMEYNGSTSKSSLNSRSTFSDLTLADFHMPSLIPLPIRSAEIKNRAFYTLAYCRFVHEELDNTSTEGATEIQMTRVLPSILGLRNRTRLHGSQHGTPIIYNLPWPSGLPASLQGDEILRQISEPTSSQGS